MQQHKAGKVKKKFVCSNCNYSSPKWIGNCPSCEEWNSFIEEQEKYLTSASSDANSTPVFSLSEITIQEQPRMVSGIGEWDRVVGGGILPGSLIILTGDPGIGKSTLLLQIADHIARHHKVFYFSSEESLQQVKSRATRLGLAETPLLFSDQAYLDSISATVLEQRPSLVILDSIQNCHLAPTSHALPGTIAQLREAGFMLMRLAKEHNIAILVTGHITKDGTMAGPKVLEHMVDAVFYLQGEDRWQTRMLRAVKNRFGSIQEVGFFEMHQEGMIELTNINQRLLSDVAQTPGSALVCCMEGSRPLLLEMQALCIPSKFGMPQRVVTGVDPKRVVLVAAILEKYLQVKLSQQDIFFKVGGGFKVKESSADLGIALALLSSYFQVALPARSVAIGEVSLTGQVKATNYIDHCMKEIEKFGFAHVFLSLSQKVKTSCSVKYFKNVFELLGLFPEK